MIVRFTPSGVQVSKCRLEVLKEDRLEANPALDRLLKLLDTAESSPNPQTPEIAIRHSTPTDGPRIAHAPATSGTRAANAYPLPGVGLSKYAWYKGDEE